MSRPSLRIDLASARQLTQALGAVPKKLKAAQKRAVRKSMTVLTKATRAKAPNIRRRITVRFRGQTVRLLGYGTTGLLKKSLGNKTGVSRKTGGVYGLVGPRRKKDFPPIIAYNPITRERVRINPTNYAHLVEFGFRQVVRWGKRLKMPVVIRPKPFMRPAFDVAKPGMESTVVGVMREEIAKMGARP